MNFRTLTHLCRPGALEAWLLAACLGVGSVTGCAVVQPEGIPEGPPATSLAEDLDALRDDFNSHVGQARVVAFLSPTCPYSEQALAGLDEALKQHPEADVRVLVVWLDEMPEDCVESGRVAAMRFRDNRVGFYHDARRRASMVLARLVMPVTAVSRTMLCYDPGMEWGQEPPQPVRVAHQMGRLAPGDYCSPEQLPSVLSSEWHSQAN